MKWAKQCLTPGLTCPLEFAFGINHYIHEGSFSYRDRVLYWHIFHRYARMDVSFHF